MQIMGNRILQLLRRDIFGKKKGRLLGLVAQELLYSASDGVVVPHQLIDLTVRIFAPVKQRGTGAIRL